MVLATSAHAARGKRMLTGETVDVGAPLVKADDGSGIGFGFKDEGELRKYFFMQIIAWAALVLFKLLDWWKQARDSTGKDLKEVKMAILDLTVKLTSIERDMVKEHHVIAKVREEIQYLTRNKNKF